MMDWLTARVMATPEKTFLHIDDERLPYAEVNRLVAACAAVMRDRGIEPGDKVAILMPSGPACVVTVLALMRLGAVFVPLNSRLTTSELAWQIENADCRMVITQAETSARLRGIDVNVLEFPSTIELVSASDADSIGAVDLHADCAIIHTSGTTGRPKAAVLTYGNFYHSAMASAYRLGVLPDDRWLCILPLYHVGGLSIILRSLLYGTGVELMSSTRFDVEAVNHLLSEKPISIVSLVPTMLGRLLDAKALTWNARLRWILLGGEAAPAALIDRCLAAEIPVAASYGLSEASSQVATALPDLLRIKPGSVGKPVLFTRLRIVDDAGRDVAEGTPGEVIVQGPTVMREYYNDAAATGGALKDGWLHTGDIGFLDSDGDLHILQRRADLIVSGGENVYPAEVENVLRLHPAVAETIVFGIADAHWGQGVAAVIELRAAASVSAEEIMDFSRERLAAYKVPRMIAFVDSLPRTASGKIQRREAQQAYSNAISHSR